MVELPDSRPTEDITFDDGNVNSTETTQGQKDSGYLFEEIIPSSRINWSLQHMARHIRHLQSISLRGYDSLFAAIQATLPGQRFTLHPDGGANFLEQTTITVDGGGGILALSCDSRHIYILIGDGSLYAYPNDGTAVPVAAWSRGNAAGEEANEPFERIDADGASVIYSFDDGGGNHTTEILNAATGAVVNAQTDASALYTAKRGQDVFAVPSERRWVTVKTDYATDQSLSIFYEGTISGTISSANLVEVRAHCASVDSEQEMLFIFHARTAGSEAYVSKRLLSALASPSRVGVFNDALMDAADMVMDRDYVYILGNHTSGVHKYEIRKISKAGNRMAYAAESVGEVVWTWSLDTMPNRSTEDSLAQTNNELCFVNEDEGAAYILSKETGKLLGRIGGLSTTGTADGRTRITSDGSSFFIASGFNTLIKVSSKTLPSEWLRCGDGINNTGLELDGIKYSKGRSIRRMALPLTKVI